MARVSASILSFYFDSKKKKESSDVMMGNINDALEKKKSEYQILHLDIMDGKFVPHKSFSAMEVRHIKCKAKKEAHFMVVDYEKYLHDYFPLAQMFIFHSEVLRHDFAKTIKYLKDNKKFVGISIDPDTHLSELKYLDKVDLVLVMSVYPGKPGQRFIDTSLRKIKRLAEMRREKNYHFAIEVDGGINKENKDNCIKAGADILVMGTGIFKE